MPDGVIITIELVIKPELAEAVCAGIPAMVADTPGFEGFRSIRVVRHQAESNRVLIIEHWDAAANYHAYQAWRNRDGALDAAKQHLISLTANVWPGLVGSAAI